MTLNYTEAFMKYGGKLTNPQWSVSAFNVQGELIVSLWQNQIKSDSISKTMTYTDKLSDWKGNETGKSEFKRHLIQVIEKKSAIRLIIAIPATSSVAKLVGKVKDESSIPKEFSIRSEIIGNIDFFDGDELKIIFRKNT